jgi:hypothetical protein
MRAFALQVASALVSGARKRYLEVGGIARPGRQHRQGEGTSILGEAVDVFGIEPHLARVRADRDHLGAGLAQVVGQGVNKGILPWRACASAPKQLASVPTRDADVQSDVR